MLVLTRKVGETILIGDDIVITVVNIGNSRMKLAIDAPAGHRILRSELEPHGSCPSTETVGPLVWRRSPPDRLEEAKTVAEAMGLGAGGDRRCLSPREHAPFLRGDLGVCSNSTGGRSRTGQSRANRDPPHLNSIRRIASKDHSIKPPRRLRWPPSCS